MPDSADVLVTTHCKKCKARCASGPKCRNCGSQYHPGCARALRKIKIIDENTVDCCTVNPTNLDEGECTSPYPEDNHTKLLLTEIKFLKETVMMKDVIIQELREEIRLHKENEKLKNLIETLQDNAISLADNDCHKKPKQIRTKPPVLDKTETTTINYRNLFLDNSDTTKQTNVKESVLSDSTPPVEAETEKPFTLVLNKKRNKIATPQSEQPMPKLNPSANTNTITKKLRHKPNFGSGAVDSNLKPYIPISYLHVSKVDLSCSVDQINNYINSKLPIATECTELEVVCPTQLM